MSRRDVALGLIAGGFASLPFPAHAARQFDVRDHGARGDGRTIDSAAINAAVLAASAGAISVFPCGCRAASPCCWRTAR